MIPRSKVLLAAHRVLLRLSAGRLRPIWALGYRLLARAWIAYLVRGEAQATAYLRGSLTGEELLPGLSDIDVAIVLGDEARAPGTAAQRTAERWTRLRHALPVADLVVDYPLVLEERELAEVTGASALTFGLDGSGSGAVYHGARVSQDRIRMLERPGLYGSRPDWHLVRGRDRRPAEPPSDRQARRIAAWLELGAWWQWVFGACARPEGPRTASLCVKLVAEPARIWLWLAHGERAQTRADALVLAQRRLPAEEPGLSRALSLLRALPSSPAPPLAETLAATVRFSRRIAELIADEIADAGATEVRLLGGDRPELILGHGRWHAAPGLADGREPPGLPLCDFRALTHPRLLDECFVPVGADLGDPAVLGLATTSQDYGPYPGLHADDLMVFPGNRARSRLRAIKAAMSDPVTFALLAGRQHASFPNVAGWSAHDLAARAVAEHEAWLRTTVSSTGEAGGFALAKLLSAARVALFAQSLQTDATPELALTATETADRLAESSGPAGTVAQEGLERYRDFAIYRMPPPADTLTAMRKLVLGLPAYGERHPAATAN